MVDCKKCEEKNKVETSIPYIVYESGEARHERREKRLIFCLVLLIVLLVGSNIGWLVYESQWETISTIQEVSQDAENGSNSFVGGDVINGETDNNNKDN